MKILTILRSTLRAIKPKKKVLVTNRGYRDSKCYVFTLVFGGPGENLGYLPVRFEEIQQLLEKFGKKQRVLVRLENLLRDYFDQVDATYVINESVLVLGIKLLQRDREVFLKTIRDAKNPGEFETFAAFTA